MLAWLKDLLRPIRRVDPLLGQMRYRRDGEFWEASASFAPVARQVDVLLAGTEAGPTGEQREFFRALEARYAALWPKVEQELRETASADPSHSSGSRFVLNGIDLCGRIQSKQTWELLYETEPSSWFFAVEIHDWTPINVSVEC